MRAGRTFCCREHRAQWLREHQPRGVVRSVRRTDSGGTRVVLHFEGAEAERALHMHKLEVVTLQTTALK